MRDRCNIFVWLAPEKETGLFCWLMFKNSPHGEMNQQRESNFERFSIIRETWHLDPLRRRLLRSHFFDALSSLISVKVESKLRQGETSRRIRTIRNVEPVRVLPFFPPYRCFVCEIIYIINKLFESLPRDINLYIYIYIYIYIYWQTCLIFM